MTSLFYFHDAHIYVQAKITMEVEWTEIFKQRQDSATHESGI